MKLQYFGHSAFLIETKGKKLLFDPFIKGNPLASDVNIDQIQADYILLTHGHGDHVGDCIDIAIRNKAKIISSFEVCNWLSGHQLDSYGLNIGGQLSFDFGMVKMLSAQHSSSMPDGSYGGSPVGYVVSNDEICFYVSGDTGLSMDMKLIPLFCPKLDFAILCMGDIFTMGYKDAALASDFIECDNIIACHFDTFDPIKINHDEVKEYFNSKTKKLIIPKINETIEI